MKKLLNIATLLTGILLMSTAYGKQEQPSVIITPIVTGVNLVKKAKAKRANKAKKSNPNYKVQLTQGVTKAWDTTHNLVADAYHGTHALIEATPHYTAQLIQGATKVWDTTNDLLANAYHGVSNLLASMDTDIDIADYGIQNIEDFDIEYFDDEIATNKVNASLQDRQKFSTSFSNPSVLLQAALS